MLSLINILPLICIYDQGATIQTHQMIILNIYFKQIIQNSLLDGYDVEMYDTGLSYGKRFNPTFPHETY